MAYPPQLPPATRTDSTISAVNHAQDHNRIAAALGDIVAELGASPAGSYANLTERLLGVAAGADQAALDAFADLMALVEEARTAAEEARDTAALIAIGNVDATIATLVAGSSGSATAAALLEEYVPSTEPTFESLADTELAAVSAELAIGGEWTLGAGWTGDAASGFTKTAGNTNPLTWAPPFPTGVKTYIVEWTVDTPSDPFLNYLFSITIGGSFPMVMYEGEFLTHTYKRGIQSLADGSLVFTPQSPFAGTIRNVSLKEVTTPTAPSHTFKDSTGANVLEVRPGPAALQNVFIGIGTGRFNVTGHENVGLGVGVLSRSTSGFWNVGIGKDALRDNVNGTRNFAGGFLALAENRSGHRNIGIGPFALTRNTDGISNIGLGADVLWYNRTGNYNIGLGQAALGEMTFGDANIGIGRAAMAAAEGLSYHIGIGDYALMALEDESVGNQIGIGRRALRNATRGGNIGIGYEVMLGLTTGNGHTVIGHDALKAVTTALNCTAIGRDAVRYLTGERNTGVGLGALMGVAGSSAQRNTGLGYGVGTSLISGGDRNLFLGMSVGQTTTSGSDNILIGYNIQATTPTSAYELNIGNVIYGKLQTANRQVGIGVPGPSARLHLPAGAATAGQAPLKFTTGGVLTTSPEPGAVEFDGTNLYVTTAAGVRRQLAVV